MGTSSQGQSDILALRDGRWSSSVHGVSSADLCEGGVEGTPGGGGVLQRYLEVRVGVCRVLEVETLVEFYLRKCLRGVKCAWA